MHRRLLRPPAAGPAIGSGQRRRLQTADGTLVQVEHLVKDGADSRDLCIVMTHGFTQNSGAPRVRRIAEWTRPAAGVVLVDFRGHGRSAGRSTVGWHEIHDVEAAASWARTLGYRRVATLGFSMGAAVVLRHAAIIGGVDAVVAVSGPGLWFYRGSANMRTLHRLVLSRSGRTLLRLVRGTRVSPVAWTEPYPLDPPAAAAAVTVPLLIVHGDRDDYFPAHHAWQIHRAAPESTLWMEAGFGHAEGSVTQDLAQRMIHWLAENARPTHDTTDGDT